MATKGGGEAPRAVIHKRILDSAASAPDASLEALAGAVPGASPDLVERVLDEYGDPAHAADVTTPEEPTMSDPVATPTTEELTEKQRETLEAIARAPDATQSELAEALDVSRATVNKRLNDIPGFDWPDRRAFVDAVLDEAASAHSRSPEPAEAAVDGGQLLSADAEHAFEQLQERVARLEQRPGNAGAGAGIEDTELLAKVLRAVMAAEEISAEEEVAVLEALR